jgi:hypothetical protein
MWDTLIRSFAQVVTFVWFAGALMMLVTIPACAIKIFSALWEDDSQEEDTGPISDKPGKRNA